MLSDIIIQSRTMQELMVIIAVAAISLCLAGGFVTQQVTYAHFFGETKNIDNYQVIFQPSPSVPAAGSNSTLLNFSVLENNTNINNIYVALTITEKNSGIIVDQLPYRLYEFSDITIPYMFRNATDYVVTLHTRITGNERYQASPLTASFDISVADPYQLIPFDDLMLFYVTPAAAAIAGIVIYLNSKKKI